jgi:hypothetical protein
VPLSQSLVEHAHWERWCHTHLLWLTCLFTVYVKECPSPPRQWSFPQDSRCYKLSPLQGCWAGAASPAISGWLVYLQFDWGAPLPHSLELRAPCSLCYVPFLFFSAACLLFSLNFFFSFSPVWGSVCPGGYADSAQGYLWEYHVPLSSPGGLLLPSRIGANIWWHRNPPGFSI